MTYLLRAVISCDDFAECLQDNKQQAACHRGIIVQVTQGRRVQSESDRRSRLGMQSLCCGSLTLLYFGGGIGGAG